MKRSDRQLDKGAIELIEEAVHLLRGAPLAILACYYAGGLPFVLASLYFWADMSRSPFAYQHLAGGALGLGALFVWMKFCHSIFARRLRALMAGEPPPAVSIRRCRRVFVSQTALQSSGLFVLPLALVLTLPFPWVYAFYQNLTALDDGEAQDVRSLIKEGLLQAGLWPKQNHFLLAILFAFGLVVLLNWSILCLVLPGLVKTIFGFELIFSRSVFSLLNSTFFAIMLGLTYLCVDPVLKATYALRCFYGQSRRSGEDLKAELKQQSLLAAKAAAYLVLVLMALTQSSLRGAEFCTVPAAFPDTPAISLKERVQTYIPLLANETPGFVERPSVAFLLSKGEGGAEGKEDVSGPLKSSRTPLAPAPKLAPISPSPEELDRTIQTVLQQQKYTWRTPREKLEQPDADKGLIGRFLERIKQWVRSLRDWSIEWLRKLFRHRAKGGAESGSGYGWILTLEVLLYVLVAAAIAALAILLYRIFSGRHLKPAILASEAIQPAPDLTDENLAANALPEDGWTKLGRELLAQGELRLALRAFYLASLAHLASRQLISLAKFKSNRDYERELRRRGHSFPGLLSMFGENVAVFDRIWYGLHEINQDLVVEFMAKVEQICTQKL